MAWTHLLHVRNWQQLIEPKDKLCKQRLQIIVVPSSKFNGENFLQGRTNRKSNSNTVWFLQIPKQLTIVCPRGMRNNFTAKKFCLASGSLSRAWISWRNASTMSGPDSFTFGFDIKSISSSRPNARLILCCCVTADTCINCRRTRFNFLQVTRDQVMIHQLFISAQLQNILVRRKWGNVQKKYRKDSTCNYDAMNVWLTTLALNPRRSCSRCLCMSRSGTASTTNETYSATVQ